MSAEPRLNLDTAAGMLSWLLFKITSLLQLSRSQYEAAEAHYLAVGRYLESLDPRIRVLIYPHGSMALGTTVKPKGRDEFDLDFVCLVFHPDFSDPMALYGWLVAALKQHAVYREMMEPLKRCVRLNYAGSFHMDVLPAKPDPAPAAWRPYAATCILVPDTKLEDFSPSNPLGFKAWFEEQCGEQTLLSKRAQVPLPPNEPAERKAVLQQLCQLTKRNRNIEFEGDEDAPRSVVITALLAEDYWGEADLYGALSSVTRRTANRMPVEPMVVVNPTNRLEIFSEGWIAKPSSYGKARNWWLRFASRIEALLQLRGKALDEELAALFGETVVLKARGAFTEELQKQREAQGLRSYGARLTTAAGVGSVNPRHTFFGGGGSRR